MNRINNKLSANRYPVEMKETISRKRRKYEEQRTKSARKGKNTRWDYKAKITIVL